MTSSERTGELEARLRQTPRKLVRAAVQPRAGQAAAAAVAPERSGRKPDRPDGHESSRLAQVAGPDRELRPEASRAVSGRRATWKVHRSARRVIIRLEKKREHVYHYRFHIMDASFGRLVIKMSGYPPSGAQVILNGHEYVAVAAHAEGIGFTREGNCFTEIADPQRLARVADAWPQHAATVSLGQVCDRWVYRRCRQDTDGGGLRDRSADCERSWKLTAIAAFALPLAAS